MQDLVTDLIIKTDLFIAKKGLDLSINRDMIKSINNITNEDSLDTIYINTVDNYNIPDVVIMPLYNTDFSIYLMDLDLHDTCPFGYTLEVHQRCFDKYTADELVAVIMHDILQNVMSDTAKMRFIKAYDGVIAKYKSDTVLDLFDTISHSEVTFMMFADICTRPFRVPVNQYDYIGTDDTLKAMGLGVAYDAYLGKCYPLSLTTPEERIDQEILCDHRCIKTIIDSCLDKDIRHYYNMIRTSVPLVTLNHIFGSQQTVASLGFISRNRTKKKTTNNSINSQNTAISESISKFKITSPKSVIEVRFQIDKIISEMRYAESEGERSAILFKIKRLTLQLIKMEQNINDMIKKNPNNTTFKTKLDEVNNFKAELDMLREKTLKMDIEKTYLGIWCKMAVPGYEG